MDIMDDIPLPPLFQTDHLNLLVQESPMLSPNPPPSIVESNGQSLPQPIVNLLSNVTLANEQTSVTHTHLNSSILLSNNSNFKSDSPTLTNHVIINNIRTNTTTIGLTNLESGNVQLSKAAQEKNSEISLFVDFGKRIYF